MKGQQYQERPHVGGGPGADFCRKLWMLKGGGKNKTKFFMIKIIPSLL